MSQKTRDQGAPSEVVLKEEDFKNVEEFFKHFDIPMPESMRALLDEFGSDPSKFDVAAQTRFRSELCHALFYIDHSLLRDDLFVNVRKACEPIAYELQFRKELEAELASGDD